MGHLAWPIKYLVPGPGAPLSNVINSESLRRDFGQEPFARVMIVITTADSETARALGSVFRQATPAGAYVVTNAINATADMVRFSELDNAHPLRERVDLFQSLLRVHADNKSRASMESYAQRVFPVLRVMPRFDGADKPLYPVLDRPVAEGSGNEQALPKRISELQQHTEDTLAKKGFGLKATIQFSVVELNKTRCLVDPEYSPWKSTRGCLGTSSDCSYSLSNGTVPLQSSELVIVLGANHVVMGNAADAELLFGMGVSITPPQLQGSSKWFGNNATGESFDDKTFAYAFALNCKMFRDIVGDYCHDVGRDLAVGLRYEAYLDPRTATRPSSGLVQPIALVLSTQERHDAMVV